MIRFFNKDYKAISNLFIDTIDEQAYTYPAPLSAEGTLASKTQDSKNEVIFRFPSYYESPLTLDYKFDCTFFLLTPYYQIEVIHIQQLQKQEDLVDSHGYKGRFLFNDATTAMNISEESVYDSYVKLEAKNSTLFTSD